MEVELRLMGRGLNKFSRWLTVFPAEVWQMIMSSITHPGDMYNCAMASPLLRNLLEPQKVIYLFYQVLKVTDDPSSLHQKPSLLTYLAPKEVLKCREVCTGWDNSINLYLESRPYHSTVSCLPSTDTPSHLPQDFRKDPAYHFYLRPYTILLPKIRLLLPILNSALRCPSPTRHLEILEDLQDRPQSHLLYQRRQFYIRVPPRQNLPNMPQHDVPWNPLYTYRKLTKSLLQKVGPSFRHLTIQVKNLEELQGYLELMPNLKSLYLLSNPDKESMALPTPDQTFPTLQNINKLHFEAIPDAIVKLILDSNRDVKVVEILRKPFPKSKEKTNKREVIDIPWPLNPSIFATSIRSSEELFGMPINWPRLSVLRLDFKACMESVPNWLEIFRKLEAYRDSLSELYLELPQNVKLDDKMKAWEASRKTLNLPLLKRLEFTVRSFSSLDFLLGLRSLEYLRLRLEHTESKSYFVSFVGYQVEKINFHEGFAHKFLECNLWKMMGNLKEVDLGFHSRPAQIYKRCQLNNN